MDRDSIGVGMIGSGFMGLTDSQCVKAHVEGAHLVSISDCHGDFK